ncbi:MAG TPA: hypothetical protein VHW44_31960 [Pseudonocardiaceae bacterium]|jgi:hypothetical protein|nr:hypothetical protein [Pseudonocardiaceae bacterium]
MTGNKWKTAMVGFAVVAVTGTGAAVLEAQSSYASGQPAPTAQFSAPGSARTSPQALGRAEAGAHEVATSAGFTDCEEINRTVAQLADGSWAAGVTLLCVR